MASFLDRFFPSRRKAVEGGVVDQQAITLTPVYRKRLMTEEERRSYSTELLDTYYGFGSAYIAGYIKQSIGNLNIQREMLKIVRCLPLLKHFTNSVSRVYSVQPNRKFYLDGKEVIKKPVNKKPKNEEELKPFDETMNKDRFEYNDKLYETLNNLYNDDITTSIKQAERFTNLLNTSVYKVITDEQGNMKLVFLPNDSVQVKPVNGDLSTAEQIAFVQDVINYVNNQFVAVPITENWSAEEKFIGTVQASQDKPESSINEAADEYEKLFDTKTCGSAFAPFVVFRDSGISTDFWDQKDNDIVSYIKSINMSFTELKYLEKFTSFGLKYGINVDFPKDGVIDPVGFLDIGIKNSSVPGDTTNGKNFEVGEFANAGSIDEVIKAIIFNIKMLFSMYNIPLDALISTNSVRSAESKEMDNNELFAAINAQRDIWNKNEQNLFKVMQAVHNRDNSYKIPKGVEMLVDYEEKNSTDKVADDWQVEIQNNISTYLDWLSEANPDLDRDELMDLLRSNKDINEQFEEESLNINQFAQTTEEGELVIPKVVDKNNPEQIDDSQEEGKTE